MTTKLKLIGEIKRTNDGVCKDFYDDSMTITTFIQNGGDADFTILSDGESCKDVVQLKFVLTEDNIDALIEELQKAKAQRADWADRTKSR